MNKYKFPGRFVRARLSLPLPLPRLSVAAGRKTKRDLNRGCARAPNSPRDRRRSDVIFAHINIIIIINIID